MLGPCSAKDFSTSSINVSTPSAIGGAHSTITSTIARIIAFTAPAIAVALFAIIPSTPTIRISKAATNAVTPATPETAREASPAENANIPTPQAATATPSNANAPDKPRIAGTIGPSTAPAIPKTVNAPARARSPFPISAKLIEPRDFNTGVKTASAADITNIADAPPRVPFIALSATARIVMEPARTTMPFPISSHFIPPAS